MRGSTWVLATLLGLACAGAPAAAGTPAVAGTPAAAAGPRPSSERVAFTEVKKITASDAASGDYFGAGAVSGDTAIVGSQGDDDHGDWSGSAYIYERHYSKPYMWGQRKKLTASDAEADDAFGGRVAISGDFAVVRADGEDTAGPLVGAAYVFGRNHGGTDNWGQMKKLMPSPPVGIIEGWGTPAIDGNTIAVGCLHSCEIVHIFDLDQGGPENWGEVTKVTAFDGAALDHFGQSLAVSKDTLVVGADGNDDACSGNPDCNSGAIYVFDRDKNGVDMWGHVKKRIASEDTAGDWFGESVAISGDTIAVGAPGDDGACPANPDCNSGAVYIFERDLGGLDNWGQAKIIIPSDVELGDSFGVVSIWGNILAVGSPGDDDALPSDPSSNSGAVYVFSRNHGGLGAWGLVQKLTASDAAVGDVFGSPSISGNTVLVGAQNNDDACVGDPYCNSGSAYVFMPPPFEVFVGEEPVDLVRPGKER